MAAPQAPPLPPLPPLPLALGAWLADPLAMCTHDWQTADADLLAAHGLDGLAAAALAAGRGPAPIAIDARLRQRRAAFAAAELATRAPIDAALGALTAAGIDSLLIKGEALARTLYPDPGTRVRGDADVWVAADRFTAADGVLRARGWQVIAAADGEWLQPERSYRAPDAPARIDLHRRVLSQPLLAAALGFDALHARSIAHDAIRMPDRADSLLLAALHLLGHHAHEPRAIWLYDLHCLAVPATQTHAAARAIDGGVASILLHALQASRALFGTELDAAATARMQLAGNSERAAQLLGSLTPTQRLWFDFGTLPDRRAQARWLRELLLPDPHWMRVREGAGWLPWLYLRRALRGWRRRA